VRSFGSPGYEAGDEYARRQGAAAYDRCHAPEGANRQILAICAAANVADLIKSITVPTLVVHGAEDLLIPPEYGRLTAELIPGATFKLVEGMGHDIPPALGQPLSAIILEHMRSAEN
jgi:pimeloyl-ACP methyl ester carboxylesterase